MHIAHKSCSWHNSVWTTFHLFRNRQSCSFIVHRFVIACSSVRNWKLFSIFFTPFLSMLPSARCFAISVGWSKHFDLLPHVDFRLIQIRNLNLVTNNYMMFIVYLQQQSARFLGPSRERSPTLPNSLAGQCVAANNNHPLHRPCASCSTDLCEHHAAKSFGPSPIFNESCRR